MTVYFDGVCPLCRLEISHYKAQEGAESLCFVDVTDPETDLGGGLTRETALARFHVRDQQGALISGAAAFVAIWGQLTGWRWAARVAQMPGVLNVLEVAYRAFLHVRPILARLIACRSRSDQAVVSPASKAERLLHRRRVRDA